MYTCAKIFSTIQIGCRCQCLACHEPTPNERTEQTINTSKWKFSAKPWQMHVIQSIHACICNTTMYNLSKQCASRWRPICCPLVVPFQVSCSSSTPGRHPQPRWVCPKPSLCPRHCRVQLLADPHQHRNIQPAGLRNFGIFPISATTVLSVCIGHGEYSSTIIEIFQEKP